MQVCLGTAPETKQLRVSTGVGIVLEFANCQFLIAQHSTAQHHNYRSYAALLFHISSV